VFHSPQIVLFSEDIQRAADFYSRLGFTEAFRVPREGVPIHVDLALDGYRIGIASGSSTRDDHGLQPLTHGQRAAVIVWTADTEAAYRHVTGELGAPGLRSPHVWLDRLLIAWVEDPDGHPVQIVQHLDPEPSADPR
jgi:glyoxylase I family protein